MKQNVPCRNLRLQVLYGPKKTRNGRCFKAIYWVPSRCDDEGNIPTLKVLRAQPGKSNSPMFKRHHDQVHRMIFLGIVLQREKKLTRRSHH